MLAGRSHGNYDRQAAPVGMSRLHFVHCMGPSALAYHTMRTLLRPTLANSDFRSPHTGSDSCEGWVWQGAPMVRAKGYGTKVNVSSHV